MAAGWLVGGRACGRCSLVYFSEIKDAAPRACSACRAPARRRRSAQRQRAASRRRPAASGRIVEIKAGAYGHYNAEAEINGRPVDVMVDTGASMVALSYEDAAARRPLLRDSDFTQRVSTANGMARVAPVTLDRVSIGDITVRDVPAAVMERGQARHHRCSACRS